MSQRTAVLNIKNVLIAFFFGRFIFLMASPIDGVLGYGDLTQFLNLAAIPGWPYFQHWSEYPPVIPFLFEILYRITQGRDHTFYYLLIFIFTFADMVSLYYFNLILQKLDISETGKIIRLGFYFLFLLVLPYSWWYFDPLVVALILVSIYAVLENRPLKSGIFIGIGILVKMFPVLLLPWAFKKLRKRQFVILLASVIIIYSLVMGGLYIISPDFTMASIVSQANKGSWQTIWAIVDGNYQTGNFGPLAERLNPTLAYQSIGKPAIISPWVTLILFAGFGLFCFFKYRPNHGLSDINFVGLTWCLFFIWSPGWSPQWVFYLLPLIFLAVEERQAGLLAICLVLINLTEWPILLSRGLFWTLPLTISVRTFLTALLAVLFYQKISTDHSFLKG